MRLSAGLACWLAVAGALAVYGLGVLLGSVTLTQQAGALALAGLAAVVMLGAGRGRLVVAAGLSVLAVDTWLSAHSQHRPPGFTSARAHPYSAAEDLAWLRDALSAQLAGHGPALVAVLLICGGTVMTVTEGPRVTEPWPRRIAVVVAAVVAIIPFLDAGGAAPTELVVSVGVLLPTVAALAGALTVLVVAAGRRWLISVPAILGALSLAAAILSADLVTEGPPRPRFSSDISSFLEPGYVQYGNTGAPTLAATIGGSPSLVAAPILAPLLLLSTVLLVLASARHAGTELGR